MDKTVVMKCEPGKFFFKSEKLLAEEIREIAHFQCSQLSESFLSSLGKKMVELVFSHIFESDTGILIVAIEKNTRDICGFIAGTVDIIRLYRSFLIKHTLSAVWFLIPMLLSVRKLRRMFETLLYPAKKKIRDLPKAECLAFTVSSKYRGTGLALLLWEKIMYEFKKSGVETFKLSTYSNLTRAHAFFEKLGAKKSTIEVHKGEQSYVYVFNIT